MGASAEIRAGRAFVELGAKDVGLSGGLKKAGKEVTQFGQEIFAAGEKIFLTGLSINAAIEGTALVFSTLGNDMAKAAQRTGVTVEGLSTLAFAAGEAGVGLEELEGAVAKMNKTLLGAAKGSAEAQQALAMVGLTLDDLQNKSPETRFKRIADGLAKITDSGMRNGVAMEIFGKSAAQLLPLLSQGSKGIELFQLRAKQLGLQMSSEDAEAAEIFHSRLHELELVLQHTAFVIGSAVAPALQKTNEFITKVVVVTNAWISQHKDLVEMARKASMAIVGVGAAIAGIGLGIKAVGFALSGFGSLIGYAGSALGFIVSPLGLVIAGVVALGGYLLYTSGTGAAALKYLIDLFPKLQDDATQAVQGVSNALTSGQWDVAAKIAWNGLQIEFQRGIEAIAAAFQGGKSISQAWSDMLGKIDAMTSPWLAVLGTSWDEIGGIASKAFRAIGQVAITAFSTIRAVIENFDLAAHLAAVTIELAFRKLWSNIKLAASNAFIDITEWIDHAMTKAKLMLQLTSIYAMGPAVNALPEQTAARDRLEESLYQEDQLHEGILAGKMHRTADGSSHKGAQPREVAQEEPALEAEKAKLAKQLAEKIAEKNPQTEAMLAKLEAAIKKIMSDLAHAGPAAAEKLKDLEKQRQALLAQAAKNQPAAPPSGAKLPTDTGGSFDFEQQKHEVIGSFNPFRIAGAMGAGVDTEAQQRKQAAAAAARTEKEVVKSREFLQKIYEKMMNDGPIAFT